MEPEKKDVNIITVEFLEKNVFPNDLTRTANIINQLIRKHFISKTEWREKIEKIDVSGGGSGRRLKEQLLDLLTQEKCI